MSFSESRCPLFRDMRQHEYQRKHGIEPKLVGQCPERLIDRGSQRIGEYIGDDLCYAPQKQQEIVDDIGNVRPELVVVAVPEKSRDRGHDEHEREVRKNAQESRADEACPARRILQRSTDQEAAEAEEHLDSQLAEILAVTRHQRLRQACQVEVVAEQNGRGGAEADEVVAVLRARAHQRAVSRARSDTQVARSRLLCGVDAFLRQVAGGTPKLRLNARLKAASDS